MLRLLYILALAIGIVDFITLYYFEFDRRSETELVRLSFFWAVPIVFGLAGLTAEFFSRSK
ncbi:MAG: hypothetical protein EOM25_12620, partial [Deltaproteobacteria bacterium]|nr:hypothetical protein [Deltaproteobacteria bacterium]